MASISLRNMQRRWLWILPVLLIGLLAVIAGDRVGTANAQSAPTQVKKSSLPQPKAPEAQPQGPYTVIAAEVSRTLLITGELQAIRSREIQVPLTKASSTSTITYMAPEGEVIKQGQKLIEYDASSLLSLMDEQSRTVDEAGLSIEKTKKDQEATRTGYLNNVAQAEGNLKIAKLNADIPENLQPRNTYLKYQNDYEKAKLTLTRAKETLANFEASYDSQIKLSELSKSNAEIVLKRMQGDLNLLSVDAPQDGIVIYGDNWQANRRYQVGDQAFPGMTVITLPDLSSMQVNGYIYDTELQFLAPGMGCDINLDAVPGRVFHGKIESLTSVATRKGFATTQKVFKAIIRLDSVDLSVMKPGMTAHAEVTVSMGTGLTSVPRQYIGLDGKGRYIVLKETGPKTPPAPELVKVGVFGDQMVQIVSGLNIGDRVLPAQQISEEK
jgi:HlyD family secretion protein